MPWERQINVKTSQELKIMRKAGRINAEALAAARVAIRPGVTTADLNAAAEEVIKKHGCFSPFLNYPGPYPYPASTTVSVNDEMVHGIPGKRKLKEGDIVSVDCGTVLDGWVADSAFTAGVGEISEEAERIIEVTRQALKAGISKMVAGNFTGAIGNAIEKYVRSQGMYVTHTYTGHGVGRRMHEGPQVPNYGRPGGGTLLQNGLTIAVEPMVLIGTPETRVMPDEWTVVSADRSLTAHYEHTIAITENGPVVLTVLENDPDYGLDTAKQV
ncbi:MAG: type I methionyl aminopeptidase [Leptolinea sp.]